MGATPFQLMTGRVPRTAFSVLAGDGPDGWCVKEEEFSPEMMQKSVAGWVSVQEELRREVLERVRAARDRKRVAASTGSMPNFEVGDYVLVARVRKMGSAPKLVTTWTGPWRVVFGRVSSCVQRARHRDWRDERGSRRADACLCGFVSCCGR